MNYKIICLILLFAFIFGNVFSKERWNITVTDWKDLSAKKNKTIGTMIKKSLAGQLEKNANFHVVPSKQQNLYVENFTEAVKDGRIDKSDVVVYGSYYTEGDKLFVTAQVFDVLENRLKMQRYYQGVLTVDIFDTIDSMAADLAVKVQEALPEITVESEVKIKKIRETLYESEKVNIKRTFYTRFGFISDLGYKKIAWEGGDGYTNMLSQIAPAVGFAFRLWDLRLDLMGSGITYVPYYDGRDRSVQVMNAQSYYFVALSYYLPWFDGKWAVGLGMEEFSQIGAIDYNKSGVIERYDSISMRFPPIIFCLRWVPFPDLELNLSLPVYPFVGTRITGLEGNNPNDTYDDSFSFPPIRIDGIYFWGSMGVEAFFRYGAGKYTSNYGDKIGRQNDFTTIGVYLGIVYRVDFLK